MIFLYLIQTIKGHDNKLKIGGLFNNNFVKCLNIQLFMQEAKTNKMLLSSQPHEVLKLFIHKEIIRETK
jgi:hypothetical protein